MCRDWRQKFAWLLHEKNVQSWKAVCLKFERVDAFPLPASKVEPKGQLVEDEKSNLKK